MTQQYTKQDQNTVKGHKVTTKVSSTTIAAFNINESNSIQPEENLLDDYHIIESSDVIPRKINENKKDLLDNIEIVELSDEITEEVHKNIQKATSDGELSHNKFLTDIGFNQPLLTLEPDHRAHFCEAATIPIQFTVNVVQDNGAKASSVTLNIKFHQIFMLKECCCKLPPKTIESVSTQIQEGITELLTNKKVTAQNKEMIQRRFLKIVKQKFAMPCETNS